MAEHPVYYCRSPLESAMIRWCTIIWTSDPYASIVHADMIACHSTPVCNDLTASKAAACRGCYFICTKLVWYSVLHWYYEFPSCFSHFTSQTQPFSNLQECSHCQQMFSNNSDTPLSKNCNYQSMSFWERFGQFLGPLRPYY